MKKEVTIVKSFCDTCGKEASSYSNCDHCGKELCYDCAKLELKDYKHAVSFSGSGDGSYCLACDAELIVTGNRKHSAYRKIESLRNEAASFYADHAKRAKKAEEDLAKLL